jgi:TetR/AcrR family transcriptional regulator of autoinduction and epiphytic fitness
MMQQQEKQPSGRRPVRNVDGRRLRSERTQRVLIDAYLELLREGVTFPTSRQVARKSGRCERAVYEHFHDLPGLSFAALDEMFQHVARRVPLKAFEGPRPERLRAYVEARSTICEEWLPLWRAASSHEQRTLRLTGVLDRIRAATSVRLKLMFEPELSALEPAEAEELVTTLEMIVDFESWVHLRERRSLSVEAARALWLKAMERILPDDRPRATRRPMPRKPA